MIQTISLSYLNRLRGVTVKHSDLTVPGVTSPGVSVPDEVEPTLILDKLKWN